MVLYYMVITSTIKSLASSINIGTTLKGKYVEKNLVDPVPSRFVELAKGKYIDIISSRYYSRIIMYIAGLVIVTIALVYPLLW